jgi:hypothetical protein
MSASVSGPPFRLPGYSCVGLTCFHLPQRARNFGIGSIVTSFSTWRTAMSRASSGYNHLQAGRSIFCATRQHRPCDTCVLCC